MGLVGCILHIFILLMAVEVAALVFVLLEYAATCPDEFFYIWKRPFSGVKMTYIFSRYVGLLFQIVNYLILKLQISHLPVPTSTCLKSFIFQTACFYVLFLPMNAILMLRVYAMYDQSQQIGMFLTMLWCTEALLSIVSSIRVIILMEFDVICFGTVAPSVLWIIGVAVTLSQVITLSMTTAKRKAGSNPVDFRIVRTVLWDGLWVFAIVAAMTAATVPYQFAMQVLPPYIAFTWPNALISFTTCRLIMNMQMIDADENIPPQYEGRSPDSIYLPPFLTEEAVNEEQNI